MSESKTTTRPPIIAVMGHIDHGKSTLLDYIRKSNVAEGEAGGITQHLSAYEIHHESEEADMQMTFLDTPGHEAFISMRQRGATVADIGILVVAADDGVQEQTIETIKAIKERDLPFIVAINKMDKPGANSENIISQLAEHEVYVEGFGGDVSYVEISATEGDGIDELLDLIALNAELLELEMTHDTPAKGVVIESSVDPQRGTQATLILLDGTLERGMTVQAGGCISPVRIFEDFKGKNIDKASATSPVRVVGFNEQPVVGASFRAFDKKADARDMRDDFLENEEAVESTRANTDAFTIPIVIKTDVSGTATAITHEIKKLHSERAALDVVHTGVGDITEDDVRAVARDDMSGIVVGFNVSPSPAAETVAGRRNVTIMTAPVIYDITQWLKEAVEERTPTITVKEVSGEAKIIKNFSSKRDMQVVGGEVIEGTLLSSSGLKIIRNETEIADAEMVELQHGRSSTDSVKAGQNFGANIRSRVDIAPGDIIQSFELIEK